MENRTGHEVCIDLGGKGAPHSPSDAALASMPCTNDLGYHMGMRVTLQARRPLQLFSTRKCPGWDVLPEMITWTLLVLPSGLKPSSALPCCHVHQCGHTL